MLAGDPLHNQVARPESDAFSRGVSGSLRPVRTLLAICSALDARRGLRPRTATLVVLAFTISLVFLAVVLASIALDLQGARVLSPLLPLPPQLRALTQRDELAYPSHAVAATLLSRAGAPSSMVAIQWVKAASHASSEPELRRAAEGIADAVGRSDDPSGLTSRLCTLARRGSPAVQAATALAGLQCGPNHLSRAHVPDGTPIEYGSHPPIGGPHYREPYPAYGLAQPRLPAGRWVFNLERGAIVLLFNCPAPCPELVSQLEALAT